MLSCDCSFRYVEHESERCDPADSKDSIPRGECSADIDMFAQKSVVNKEASAKENVIAPPQVALC